MKRGFTKALALLLALVMLVGILPVSVLAANDDTDYLFIATDRHTNTSIIGNVINNMESYIGENELDYLALGGDMVGSSNSHPAYNSSTVLGEVTGATSSLSAANVDIVAGIHDKNVTDDAGIVLPYQGGGAKIYEGDRFYVYGVEEYCISEASNESNWYSEAQKFVTWANGSDIDKSKVIVVVSHYPLHAKRNDNDGAYYWHQALNTVATGAASGDSTVERNILFFHGHNHTVDFNEYVYNVGDTMSIQNGSSTASEKIYYTYATAGYLNQNRKATLVTITDDTVSLTKYSTSGSGTAMTSVERVEQAAPEVTEQTFYSAESNWWAAVTATATGATFAKVEEDTKANELLSYWYGYDISLEGQVEGTSATVMLWLDPEAMSSTDLAVYYLNEDGAYEAVTGYTVATDEDGAKYITISNAALGTYVYGTPNTDDAIPEGAVLARLDLTGPEKTKYFLSEDLENGNVYLDITGLGVTAVYTLENEEYTKTLDWNRFDETVDGYALSFGDLTTKGEKTVTVSYGDKSAAFTVWVCEKEVVAGDVTVTFDAESVIALTVETVEATEIITTAVADVIKGDVTVYSFTPTYANGDTGLNGEASVTLPIPEGVTTPAVYYVSDDGKTVTNMGAKDNGDDTVTFTTTHFSTYVIGESTEITVPDPETATGSGTTTTTTTKTVYVLSSGNPSGEVLIASSNTAGSVNLVANDGGDLSNTSATVVYGDCDGDGDSEYYIELTEDEATNSLWTVAGTYTFENQDEYLRYNDGLTVSSSSTTWSYSNNRLSYRGSSSSTRYLRYNSGWTTTRQSDSATRIYFYVPTEIEVETNTTVSGTYSIAGEDLSVVVAEDTTANLSATLTFKPSDGGTATTEDVSTTATYEIVNVDANGNTVDGDPNDIISKIENGAVTFTGNYGTALVKVSYTTNFGVVTDYITVTASEPYYSLDLYKANVTYTEATGLTEFAENTIYYTQNEDGTYTQLASDATFDSSVTYYTISYTLGDEITAPIAIKGVEAGDRYGVWAVVKYYDGTDEDGTDKGTVGSDIEWSSSDETIATVDKNTGIITFTGKEGTVNITATYTNGNRPSDTITISVTQSQYSVPADGTSDFPEYPNEGAIRYDKTATAVGNFSETGIAQVELSMTGVPYTTGSEIDVVIMLDMTGSMSDTAMTAAEESAIAFAEQIVKNTDGTYNGNRIAILAFNSGSSSPYTYWELGTVDSDTEWSSLCTAVRAASKDQVSGGTPYDEALAKCQEILTAAKTDGTGNDRQQFCVFVSDGGPTSYEYITNYDEVKAGTATEYDTFSASATGGSNQSDSNFATIATYTHEYYSTLMKDDGVTMFSVLTGLSADDYPNCATILENIASSSDNAYVVEDGSDTSALTDALGDIAVKILQAATDVTVEDKISNEYTMIFDLPEGSKDITGLDSQEFYIEFVKYTLDENHERTDTVTSVTKLYLGVSNGSYYAASDANGTAYATPVFAQSALGDKGTLYYWTTDDSYASKAAVTYTNSDDTYYFIPYGMEAKEDGTAPDGWYNMTSGAYASGTIDSTTNMSTNLVIATPYFVYNASTKMLYWTVDKLDNTEYALRYFLYLDRSATEVGTTNEVDAGTYPTNDHAYITYTNFKGNECQQHFPVPQQTWNGAQVSYVFYLVNSAGQPINKSGQVVDFANATFITDIYTTSVVWNKGTDGQIEGDANLSIDWLADNLLPDEYELYDEEAEYELKVYADASGNDIFNYFTIDGSTAATISTSLNSRLSLSTSESTVSVETTKVYNTKAGTRYDDYGTYASKSADGVDTVLSNFDFANTTVAFAVVWQPRLVPDTVVVDFGLDVLINVVQNDILQNTVSGIGLGNEAYGSTAMNTGVSPESKLGTAALTTSDGSTISIENENQIRFHQNDMTFEEPVTFYYESPVAFYENSEQKTGYMYSSVTVIPATSIYYEDGFVSYANSTVATETYGKWGQVGSEISATQDQDRPGESQISADLDADNIYGYDSAYENCTQYSLGGAQMVTVDALTGTPNTCPTATFTFTGTAFDIISLTDSDSGVIMVTVTGANGNQVAKQTVDNYYGYDFYAYYKTVYTYTEITDEEGNKVYEWVGETIEINAEDMGTPGTRPSNPQVDDTYTEYGTNKWVEVPGEEAIWQVPVIKMDLETYGTYTVTIQVAYLNSMNHAGDNRYSFWMDAVRIYNPAKGNDTAEDAYVEDKENNPDYKTIRDILVDANALTESTSVSGVVFIDGIESLSDVATYANPGPNNETYLADQQAIAFKLIATEKLNEENPITVHIGAKLAYGEEATLMVGKSAFQTLTTATDMYYDLTDALTWRQNGDVWESDPIVLTNSTDRAVISLTNIKLVNAVFGTVTTDDTTEDGTGDETQDAGVATVSVVSDATVTAAAFSVMRMLYAPVEEVPVFEPEEFSANWVMATKMNRPSKLNILTSDDVAYVTVNGVVIENFRNNPTMSFGKHGFTIVNKYLWTYTETFRTAGTYSYEVIAYDENGVASEPIVVEAVVRFSNTRR